MMVIATTVSAEETTSRRISQYNNYQYYFDSDTNSDKVGEIFKKLCTPTSPSP